MALVLMRHFMLAAALVLAMSNIGSATGTSNATEEFLSSHNTARMDVGVPPLQWSTMLATMVSRLVRYQRNNKDCDLVNLSSSKFGSNQAWIGSLPWTPRQVVEHWVERKKFYNHANNTCTENELCGLYTQVVWRKTMEVGCGQVVCRNGNVSSLTICLYNPRGNVKGERPY